MNSSIACRYPRFDSGERRPSRTAHLLWSRSGRPSFDLGHFGFGGVPLECLLIPSAKWWSWARLRPQLPAWSSSHSKMSTRATLSNLIRRNKQPDASPGILGELLSQHRGESESPLFLCVVNQCVEFFAELCIDLVREQV